MNDYKFFKPEDFIEPTGFIETKLFSIMEGMEDIMKKRLIDHYSIPSPSVIADSSFTKSISASEQIFEREKNFFGKLKKILFNDRTYANKFIAIIDDKIVDSDYDRSMLAERVYTKYGYVQLFIGKVVKQEIYRKLPSPKRMKV